MTPEERQMITGLFDRLYTTGLAEKDKDADALIKDAVRQFPDSQYMLVQTALVQEMVLNDSQARIQELEERIRVLESQGRAQPQQSSGSFLGGLFGGSRPASAPPVASRQQSGSFGAPPARPMQQASPWGQPMGSPAMQAQQGQPQRGGFVRTAMATAAGVAGGMLAANAISNMMNGGSSAQAAGTGATPSAASADPGSSSSEGGYGAQDSYQSDSDNDPGTYDAGGDGGGWGGDE